MRRSVALLWAVLLLALVGCAGTAGSDPTATRLRYPEVLSPQGAPTVAESKLRPPRGDCRRRALQRLGHGGRLLAAPLSPRRQAVLDRIVDGLHPKAKRVLARVRGVWLADDIPGAAAVYFACNMNPSATAGGFVLLDAGEYPVELPLRDVDVPALYWRALAGVPTEAAISSDTGGDQHGVPPEEHALRYLLLHELGHALSLYAGEFDLSDNRRFRVGRTDGFVRFSWRLAPPPSSAGSFGDRVLAKKGVAPRVSLSLREWASVLSALDADPALPSPLALWVRSGGRQRALEVCRAAGKLTRAGFVTPAAALYPTEDYAETFAHAILADERKIAADDRLLLDLPHCGLRQVRSPYFSPWVAAKRDYIERALGLSAME